MDLSRKIGKLRINMPTDFAEGPEECGLTVLRLSQRDWMAWMKRPLAAELRCTALMKSCTGGSWERLMRSCTWLTINQVRCSESCRF